MTKKKFEEYLNENFYVLEKKIINLIHKFEIYHDNANDLKQDILLKVSEKISTFEERAKLETWIYRIVINHCINYQRKKREVLTDRIEHFNIASNIIKYNPEHNYLNNEINSIFNYEIDKLPEKIKNVFSLYYIKKFSQQQIASRLKIPIGTVWSRINRAKTILKEKLQIH